MFEQGSELAGIRDHLAGLVERDPAPSKAFDEISPHARTLPPRPHPTRPTPCEQRVRVGDSAVDQGPLSAIEVVATKLCKAPSGV